MLELEFLDFSEPLARWCYIVRHSWREM